MESLRVLHSTACFSRSSSPYQGVSGLHVFLTDLRAALLTQEREEPWDTYCQIGDALQLLTW